MKPPKGHKAFIQETFVTVYEKITGERLRFFKGEKPKLWAAYVALYDALGGDGSHEDFFETFFNYLVDAIYRWTTWVHRDRGNLISFVKSSRVMESFIIKMKAPRHMVAGFEAKEDWDAWS